MTEPAAQSIARVPRSRLDDLFIAGDTTSPARYGIGVVVSVEAETCTCQIGDEEISGIVFLGDPPTIGDVVEIEMRGDLMVVPETLPDLSSTQHAEHLVSTDDPPGTPQPFNVNISGSMREVAEWYFLPPDDASWQRELAADLAGLRVWQTAAPTGTMWSDVAFPVGPLDSLDFTIDALKNAGVDATLTIVICYDASDVGTVFPGGDVQVITYNAIVVNGQVQLLGHIVVPEVIIAATSGETRPVQARVGLRFTATGTADLEVEKVQLIQTPGSWTLGAVWFNPSSADEVAVPTIASTGQGDATIIDLPSAVAWTRLPGAKKATIRAPDTAGGIAVVTGWLNIIHRSGAQQVNVRLQATGGGNWPMAWCGDFASLAASQVHFPILMIGSVLLDAGEEQDVWFEYQYSAAPATISRHRNAGISVMFIPTAVRPAGVTTPPMMRYWDGAIWRPQGLDQAGIDLTQDSTVTPPVHTATTTTCTRSPATLKAGEKVTLTAKVTPAAATGSVTFYKGTAAGGPWTSLGTVKLPAGSTTVNYQWTTTKGTWWFRAKYLGSATYAASEDVTDNATTVNADTSGSGGGTVTKTLTRDAGWVQAYAGGGGVISGSGRDNAVHQGYYSSTYGNRKSAIRFNMTALPADADVTKVELICKGGGWDHWYDNSGGTVIVGWHEATGSAPNNWSNFVKHLDQQRSGQDTGGWTIVLNQWARDVVKRADFGGITIGPGPSNSTQYYGYSDTPGANFFSLRVTYRTAT